MGKHASIAARLPALLLAASLPVAAAATGEVAPPADARELGRPPELLAPGQARELSRALARAGFLPHPADPLALRHGLLAAQAHAHLAPTGWLDTDTARLLGLDPARVLPIVAGAGVMSTPGTTAGGGMVGGIPGPASPVPSAAEVGADVTVPGDATYHLGEARRLTVAAARLQQRAATAPDPAPLRAQARKAQRIAAIHAERYRELGGAAKLAGERR